MGNGTEDKFEQWLEQEIAYAYARVERKELFIGLEGDDLKWICRATALQDALEAYRKHKAEQDAPELNTIRHSFRVGDKVRLIPDFAAAIPEGLTGEILILVGNDAARISTGIDRPWTLHVDRLEPIEESEDAS